MKHIFKGKFYPYENKIWRVNGRASGLRTDILRSLLKQFLFLTKTHKKLFVYGFELHVKSWQTNNSRLTRLFKNLSKRALNQHKSKLHFFWVRERHYSSVPHYHVIVYLDGYKVNTSYKLLKWLNELWIDGSVSRGIYRNLHCKSESDYFKGVKNSITCYRKNSISSDLQWVTKHLSYVAKARGKEKGKRSPQVKDFGHSRIPK